MRAEPKPGGGRSVTAGLKTLVCVGVHFTTSSNNNRVANCMHVCVEDNEQKGEEGAACWDGFPLIQSCLWRIENQAHAVGYDDPFDVTEETFKEMVMSRPFLATITMGKDNQGRDRPEVTRMERLEAEGDKFPEAWTMTADQGTKRFNEIVSRWGQGRNRRASSRPTEQHGAPDGGDFQDDEIPF
jgi:hypothetical protein